MCDLRSVNSMPRDVRRNRREADLFFQQANLFTHCGLRDVEPRRRFGKASLLGYRKRISNFAKFHAPLQAINQVFSDFAYCQIAKGESRDGMLALRRSDDEVGPDLRLAGSKQPGNIESQLYTPWPKILISNHSWRHFWRPTGESVHIHPW